MTNPVPPTNPSPPLGLAAAISLTVKAVLVALVSLGVIALTAEQQSSLVIAIAAVVDLGLYLGLYFGLRHKAPGE